MHVPTVKLSDGEQEIIVNASDAAAYVKAGWKRVAPPKADAKAEPKE
jgi:hypothetical protein